MVIRPATPADSAALAGLLEAARAHDGRDPLSDHKHLALRRGDGMTLVAGDYGAPTALVQVVDAGNEAAVEMVVHPDRRDPAVAAALLDAALATVPPRPRARVWAFDADQVAAIERRGGRLARRIAQLRRPLPPDRRPELPPGVAVRPFRPGADEDALLAVNNEAFAGHPENGAWDRAVLAERMRQEWFDPAGLLLACDDAGLAGFCWTKLHPEAVGEIYVIAVAGRAAGRGLGRELARCGLWDLAERRGAETAMLYAEEDNVPGRAMYRALGFSVTRIDACYLVPVPGGTG